MSPEAAADNQATWMPGAPGTSASDATLPSGATGPLTPGQPFGARYHIIRLLGAGGMGAVYQAWDEELGVAVAIKVIRPEVMQHPAAAAQLEQRFKRELLLARQVTHRNVVRIHDLGEIDGIKYISMPYVQGANLEAILKRDGRLPVARALRIAREVGSGLAAAHEAGVVHRDLKPANIMIDADDHALIMDFGIARSISADGGTMAGVVLGTFDYMAPEQAMARPTDHRTDIYSFGLILGEMLVGRWQAAGAQSAVADLMQRIQQSPPPIRTRDASLSEDLERLVARCLEPDPAARYQTTAELMGDLATLDADGHRVGASPEAKSSRPSTAPPRAPHWSWIASAAALFALSILIAASVPVIRTAVFGGRSPQAPSTRAVSLAILPFRNATGDSSLNWLGQNLAEMIKTELGQSAGLRIVSSDRLFQILRDLRIPPDAEIDQPTLARLREFSNAETLVSGAYARFGTAIRIDASIRGAKGEAPLTLKAEAASETGLPQATRTLAQLLQQDLAIAPVATRSAGSAPAAPTSTSMQALKAYTEGQQLDRQGNHLGALKQFKAATEADSTFALAFAKLALTYKAVGSAGDAEQAARQALDLGERLPPEQKYLVEGIRARVANDLDQSIRAYENLAKLRPNDSQVLFDLAGLYEAKGAYDPARDAFARVLEQDPKYSDALYAMGRVEIRRKNPQAALDYLNRALTIAIATENLEAKGNMLHAIGIAYKRLNNPEEALRYYNEALEIRRRIGFKRGVAAGLGEIGQVQGTLNMPDEALASFIDGLKMWREIGDQAGIGNTLNDLGALRQERGEYDEALKLFKESLDIQTEVGNENYQGLCLHNIGDIYLRQGRYDDAVAYFERALKIREKSNVSFDIANTLHGLAETQTKIGEFDYALSHYLKAVELRRAANDRRGAAREFSGMAAVFEYQGRYAAALDADEEALKSLRELKDNRSLMSALDQYADTLVMMGRTDAARRSLDETLGLARQLKDTRLMALAMNVQGDSFFYRGDFKSARSLFDQAVHASAKSGSPDIELRSRLNMAKVDVKDGRSQAAVLKLRDLARRTRELRLRPLTAECTVYLGEALLAAKDLTGARRELESALDQSDKMGLRVLSAESHHLLGKILGLGGDKAGVARHSAEARQIVEAIRKDARSDDVLTRDDFHRILSSIAPSS